MIPIVRPELPPLADYVALLEEIWQSRMLSNFAEKATELEGRVAEYFGATHALTVTSGETGLMIALAALDLPEGAPAFVSSFTFNSTINAPLWNNLHPVIVDIDAHTFTMSPAALAEAMQRYPQPGVVLPTHVFGNPCDVEALEQLARDHGSFLIFDAAHGYGSLHNGKHVGTFGDAEVFSLSGTKLVSTAEGGLISTPHDWMAEKLRYFRAHGFQTDYESKVLGLNGKFSELHAALGLLTLPTVEDAITKRHHAVARYREELEGLVTWQHVRPEDRSTYKDVNIGVGSAEQADEMCARLLEQGIQTKRYFRPLHTMAFFEKYADDRRFPNTDQVYSETFCVPAYADMPDWVYGAVGETVRVVKTGEKVAQR